MVHFQRMLRYPPHERLGTLLDQGLEPVHADTSAAEVSRILASYNLVSVPVVDANSRLVGVVTIDDVLDHLLPDDWRNPESTRAHKTRAAAVRRGDAPSPMTRGRRWRNGAAD
jgi:Mg/Co/Ni transporter MgtE